MLEIFCVLRKVFSNKKHFNLVCKTFFYFFVNMQFRYTIFFIFFCCFFNYLLFQRFQFIFFFSDQVLRIIPKSEEHVVLLKKYIDQDADVSLSKYWTNLFWYSIIFQLADIIGHHHNVSANWKCLPFYIKSLIIRK